MPWLSTDDEYLRIRSLRFVRRMFLMRQLGTCLCFLPILSVLLEQAASTLTLLLLTLNAFLWPVAAYIASVKARDSVKVEQRSLTLDTLWSGVWVAIMGISPIPSLIILAIQVSDRYAAGGWRQLRPALFAFFLAFAIAWAICGYPVRLTFSARTVWLALPLATLYLVALSIVSRHLTVRLRDKTRELERVALLDPRLHIPNRRLFEQRLSSTFLQTQRGTISAWLILLDVDDFKRVNDSYGHETGDFLLAEVSEAIREVISHKDVPARFGGDELAVIVHDSNARDVARLAHQIMSRVKQIQLPSNDRYRCTISMGIAAASAASSTSEWLRNADHALYAIKRNGKNGFSLSDQSAGTAPLAEPEAEV